MQTALIVVLTLIFTHSSAHASEAMRDFAASRILQSTELRETLAGMGYNPMTAAQAFADAEEDMISKNETSDPGTLAICGEFSSRLMVIGGSIQICTTLFNSYSIKSMAIGTGNIAANNPVGLVTNTTATVNAVYFLSADGFTTGERCFGALNILAGKGVKFGGTAAAELDCESLSGKISMKKGFLIALKAGVGISADYSASILKVKHLKSYF